jgi:hypothetical protein
MKKPTIISVDLACRDYSDIGIAVLSGPSDKIAVELVKPAQYHLTGEPSATDLADRLKQLCYERKSQVLIIDGPQAWKEADNGLEHCRCCERKLNTPAKTGLPYCVKPRSYKRFVSFSVEVFNELQKNGFRLLQGENDYPAKNEVLALESFPLAAWKELKIIPLLAKTKATNADINECLERLKCIYPLNISDLSTPSHDELQAIVMGIAGISFLQRDTAGYKLTGKPPVEIDGIKREGFIIIPTHAQR